MPDMLAAGMATLTAKMTAHASTACTYRRGLSLSCTINLTAGSEMLRVTDAQGATKIERPDLDGTFAADELNFGDGLGVVPPQDGDLVEWEGCKFRLMPTANGREPSWRYCNAQHTAVRIRAKFVERV